MIRKKLMKRGATVAMAAFVAMSSIPAASIPAYAADETTTSWVDLYKGMGVSASAGEGYYDAVTSATEYKSFHAKDIPSVVSRVTDADGAITALDGVKLTGKEATVTPKLGSASFTIGAKYGSYEFAVMPDDTVEGYVWNDYIANLYAVTISDGTTTVGTLPWVDYYGEAATQGPHYNKVEVALNSGKSVGSNAAMVHRFDAFYNEDGTLKPGTYTVTVYAEGFTPLTAEIKTGPTGWMEVADVASNTESIKVDIKGDIGFTPVYKLDGETVTAADGAIAVSDLTAGNHTLTATDPNGEYADVSANFIATTETAVVAYDDSTHSLKAAANVSDKHFQAYLKSITNVSINGTKYSASGRRAVKLINDDGTFDLTKEQWNDLAKADVVISATGYPDLAVTVNTVEKIAMTAASVGGVNYYYTDLTAAPEKAVFVATVRSRRASTDYFYLKDELKQLADTKYAYAVPDGEELTGTLYGYGEGTATTYRKVYEDLNVKTDESYDVISSATKYTSHHAGDIPSFITYGQDANGDTAITGMTLGRSTVTIAADEYVKAGILKAAGETLTAEQEAVLATTLKVNPMTAPSEKKIAVKPGTATFGISKYGEQEFLISPDDTVEGYVWSEYWSNIYAATVSDGKTTVGTVHWIDLYGEKAVSGPHYNKVELALNNGTSLATNLAPVNRFAAFFDNDNKVKAGKYTVTVYAEGYEDLTVDVEVPGIVLADKTAAYIGSAIEIDPAAAFGGITATPVYTYYEDEACTKALTGAPKAIGTYYVKATATVSETESYTSNVAKLTIGKGKSSIKVGPKTVAYNGKAVTAGALTKTGSTGKVTYTYYSDEKCTKVVKAANVKNAGTYYVKATVAADNNYNAATSAAAKITINKAKSTIKVAAKTATYNKKAVTAGKVTKTGSTGKVTYKYFNAKKKAIAKAPVNAGTYYVKATVAANANYAAATSGFAKITIRKAAQSVKKIVPTAKAYKASVLKKKAQTFVLKATKVGTGKVTFKKAAGNAKIVVAANGKVTVKKGLKKGTYKVTVNVAVAGNANYAARKAVKKTFTVKVNK